MTARDGVRLETGNTKILANSAGYKPQVAPDLPGNLGGWEAGACVDSHVQSSVEWFPFIGGIQGRVMVEIMLLEAVIIITNLVMCLALTFLGPMGNIVQGNLKR